MAIDHGLGGRDSAKSQLRRQRKAKTLRKLTKQLKTASAKPGEVVFDEHARVAFLSGFHKRKQEKRRYGVAMQVLKEQKSRQEARKARRAALVTAAEPSTKPETVGETVAAEVESAGSDATRVEEAQCLVFDDRNTVGMFGSAVNVIIDQSLDRLFEEKFGSLDDHHSVTSSGSHASHHRQTKLEKALVKAKQILHQRKQSKHKPSRPDQHRKQRQSLDKGKKIQSLVQKAIGKRVR